eukprot:4120472-Prorocentrum_lima.AAC.1
MQLQWDVIDVAAIVMYAIRDEVRDVEDGDFKLSFHFPLGATPTYMDETVTRVPRKLSDRHGLAFT